VSVLAAVGKLVSSDSPVIIIESMKMEHSVAASVAGTIVSIDVEVGAVIAPGDLLFVVAVGAGGEGPVFNLKAVDLDRVRSDLSEVLNRQAAVLDAGGLTWWPTVTTRKAQCTGEHRRPLRSGLLYRVRSAGHRGTT
jgi:pyruvate/2-oxoglutarate dehydrogenase complex dihydrolipoamide acyltransferase (E2) component